MMLKMAQVTRTLRSILEILLHSMTSSNYMASNCLIQNLLALVIFVVQPTHFVGNFGQVWKATMNKSVVAVKVLKTDSNKAINELVREIGLLRYTFVIRSSTGTVP